MFPSSLTFLPPFSSFSPLNPSTFLSLTVFFILSLKLLLSYLPYFVPLPLPSTYILKPPCLCLSFPPCNAPTSLSLLVSPPLPFLSPQPTPAPVPPSPFSLYPSPYLLLPRLSSLLLSAIFPASSYPSPCVPLPLPLPPSVFLFPLPPSPFFFPGASRCSSLRMVLCEPQCKRPISGHGWRSCH